MSGGRSARMRLTSRTTSSYFSSTGNTLNPGSKIDGYSITNLRLAIENEDAGWTVAAYLKNAFDETYYVGGIGFALALSAALILTYYGVAHLAVLARVRRGDFPRALGLTSALGLIGCVVVVAGLVIAVASSSLG